MHRNVNPYCSCSSNKEGECCSMESPEDEVEVCLQFLGQPYIMKPSAIRANRGHRSWMTHLPLSRPRETPHTPI